MTPLNLYSATCCASLVCFGSILFARYALSSQNVRPGRTRSEMFRENVNYLHFIDAGPGILINTVARCIVLSRIILVRLRQRLFQLYYEKAESWFQRDILCCKGYASCIILIERSVFLARCLGFFTSLVRCVALAPHDSNIDLKSFTRKSVHYFAFCICQYMVQFGSFGLGLSC